MINFEKRPSTLFLSFMVLATTSCVIAQATKTETAANKSTATQDAAAPAVAGKDAAGKSDSDDDADADLASMNKSAAKPATQSADKSADKSSAPKAEDDAQQKQIKQLRADAELRNEQLSAKLAAMKAENDQLRLANEVAQQKQTQALQQLQAEKGKLEAELALLGAKDSTAAAPDKSKIESLQRAQKLRDAQLTDELSGLSAEQNRLKQNQDVNSAKLQAELAANKAELERAKVAEDMLDMKSRVKIANLKREQDQISAENGLAAEKRRAEQSKIADEQMRATALAQTTVKAVMASDIKVFDPIFSATNIARIHGYMVWDTLLSLDANFQVRPQMVDRWTISDDKLTYTFFLRDGLVWNDGLPVTAEDCIASIKRWAVRDPMGQKLAEFTREYRAINARSFSIVLKEPYGLVLNSLAKQAIPVPFMMPKRLAETDPYKQIPELGGSGPFIFMKDEWRPGEK